jgi:hypothetical protein
MTICCRSDFIHGSHLPMLLSFGTSLTFVFQSIKLWTFGEEDNQVKHAASETIRHARESLVKIQQLSQKTEMSEVAKLKPLASELFDFLSANLIGDYGPVLAHHDIHSIRQFSMLDAQTCRELANDASIRNKMSRVSIMLLATHTAHSSMCRSSSIIVDECLQKLLSRYFMCLDAFL